MPDLSANPGGNFSFAAALMSQSLVMMKAESFQIRRGLSIRQFLLFLLDECVVNHFQHQTPLVLAPRQIAKAAGRTKFAFPIQNVIQRPAQEWLLGGDVV